MEKLVQDVTIRTEKRQLDWIPNIKKDLPMNFNAIKPSFEGSFRSSRELVNHVLDLLDRHSFGRG